MSLHINRFIDRLRAAESRQQRDVTLTIHEARDLHSDITRLLLQLQTTAQPELNQATSVEIQLSGGTFR